MSQRTSNILGSIFFAVAMLYIGSSFMHVVTLQETSKFPIPFSALFLMLMASVGVTAAIGLSIAHCSVVLKRAHVLIKKK